MKRFFALGFLAMALPVVSSAASVFVRFGPPPPPRHVVVVRPGPRHVWVPGNYRWAGNRYAWSNGYWTLPPRGRAVWVPGYWERRHRGHVWVDGYWR